MDASVNNTSHSFHSSHENSAHSTITVNALIFCSTILGMVVYHKLDKFISSFGTPVSILKESEKEKVISDRSHQPLWPETPDVNVFLNDKMFNFQHDPPGCYLPKPHGSSKYALPESLEDDSATLIDRYRKELLPIKEASRLIEKCRSHVNSCMKMTVGGLIRECNMGGTVFSGHRIRVLLVNHDKQPLADMYFRDVIGIAIRCEKYPSSTRELLSCTVVDIMNIGATRYDRIPDDSIFRIPQYEIIFDSKKEDVKSPIKNYSFTLMEEETKSDAPFIMPFSS